MRRATIAKAGRTAAPSAFTGMAGRRVRWRNVGRVACLAAAGVLIATHGEDRPAPPRPPPRMQRPPPPPPPPPGGAEQRKGGERAARPPATGEFTPDPGPSPAAPAP